MMAALTLHSLHIGGVSMDDVERKAMRDQIVWLTQELEKARRANQDKTLLMARMLSPEDLGHAVSNEVRQLIYTTIINEQDAERESWNKK
jgi:hypothetical protein